MASKDNRDDEEARRILTRIGQESDPSGSLMTRATRKVRDHVEASDADQEDWIELWGTRIGRVLGLILLVVLVGWLSSMFFGG